MSIFWLISNGFNFGPFGHNTEYLQKLKYNMNVTYFNVYISWNMYKEEGILVECQLPTFRQSVVHCKQLWISLGREARYEGGTRALYRDLRPLSEQTRTTENMTFLQYGRYIMILKVILRSHTKRVDNKTIGLYNYFWKKLFKADQVFLCN